MMMMMIDDDDDKEEEANDDDNNDHQYTTDLTPRDDSPDQGPVVCASSLHAFVQSLRKVCRHVLGHTHCNHRCTTVAACCLLHIPTACSCIS